MCDITQSSFDVDVPVGSVRVRVQVILAVLCLMTRFRAQAQLQDMRIAWETSNHCGYANNTADSVSNESTPYVHISWLCEDSLAKLFIYSMSLDSPVRGENLSDPNAGCLAGSQALDSLDKLVTSTESYFHPSNAGHWTVAVRPVWCRMSF